MGPPREGGGPPGGFRPPMPGRGPRGDWEWLERNDPEMFALVEQDAALDRESRELADQYREAPEPERAALRAKLEETVAKHFEARQQRRALELRRLEEELKRLRESIDQRNQAKTEIVNRRVSELLGMDDPMRF